MSIQIIIDGANKQTVDRLTKKAANNNIIVSNSNTIKTFSEETNSFKCWIGHKPPPDTSYHYWSYTATNKPINVEIEFAKLNKSKYQLSFITVENIITHTSLPNSFIIIDTNNIVNSFHNIHEVEQFIIDQVTRGQI